MQIYACGNFYGTASEPLQPLKSLVEEATGESVRRVGHFIQLALIGAGRCAKGLNVPAHTGVYLSSGRGDLETTVDVMTGLFRDGQPPKPLSFVNTVSNAACFYVARNLKLRSRSNFVGNRYFAFESALQLALLDLEMQTLPSALVGSVDIACAPLSAHRQRLELDDSAAVGEGSHWLWLGHADPSLPRLGELVAAEHFADERSLYAWIEAQPFSNANCMLSAGQFITLGTFAAIQKATRLENAFDYRHDRAYYDCQSGAVVGEFLQRAPRGFDLLHLNADRDGQLSVIHVRH